MLVLTVLEAVPVGAVLRSQMEFRLVGAQVQRRSSLRFCLSSVVPSYLAVDGRGWVDVAALVEDGDERRWSTKGSKSCSQRRREIAGSRQRAFVRSCSRQREVATAVAIGGLRHGEVDDEEVGVFLRLLSPWSRGPTEISISGSSDRQWRLLGSRGWWRSRLCTLEATMASLGSVLIRNFAGERGTRRGWVLLCCSGMFLRATTNKINKGVVVGISFGREVLL